MPTLTPHADDDPSPRMEVLFTAADLHASVSTATVLQISSSGEHEVRGTERMPAVGGVFAVDYEIPPGVDVAYRVDQFDAAGNRLGLSSAVTGRVDIPRDLVIVQDPLAPLRAVRVDVPPEFASELRKRRDMALYRRGTDTIALMGEQGLLEQVPLHLNTRTREAAVVLGQILDEGDVLVRTMPGIVDLPGLFYCAVSEPMRQPVDVEFGGEWIRWSMSADEVSRIPLDVIEPVITWERYEAAFATWAEMEAAYPTWIAAEMSPPPEV